MRLPPVAVDHRIIVPACGLRDGQSPGDIPKARIIDFAYVVNMEVAQKLNIFPPMDVLRVAEIVR